MPSTITYTATANTNKASKSIYTRPQRKSKMSVTQTYFLAHSARGKLSREAARPDHDLRLLVGHANMLDSLMIDLASAEQEQERWFNHSVVGADEESEDEEEVIPTQPETIVEEAEVDWEADDAQTSDDDSEDGDELTLARTISHHSPPELTTSDSDSDSDDDQMPPSPEDSMIDSIAHKQRQAIVTSSYYEVKETPLSPVEEEDDFYLPSRSQPTIIAAY